MLGSYGGCTTRITWSKIFRPTSAGGSHNCRVHISSQAALRISKFNDQE
jgi:hypothetical protein